MKPRQLNKEDIQFLLDLQFQMNTQDTVSQASPRFWVVREEWKEWGIDSDYADNCCICDEDGNEYGGNTLEDVFKNLLEDYEIEEMYESVIYEKSHIELQCSDEVIFLCDLDDIVDFMKSKWGDLSVCYFKETKRIVPNTMFLTLKECEEHIERNHYHYNNGRPYAMTAWRSPQVAKLYEILENVVWEDGIKEE